MSHVDILLTFKAIPAGADRSARLAEHAAWFNREFERMGNPPPALATVESHRGVDGVRLRGDHEAIEDACDAPGFSAWRGGW